MIGLVPTAGVDRPDAPLAADRPVQPRGIALGVTAACTYAVGPVLMKAALESMTVWTLLLWRLLVATAVLWVLLALRRGAIRETPHTAAGWLAPLALGAAAYGGQIVLFALALERVSASMATILFHTAPIVVVAVAVLSRRERLSALRVLAVVLGVGGVAIVAAASGELRAEPLGIALSLGSAIACAGVVLGIDVIGERLAPLPLSVLMITGSTVALAAAAPVVGVAMPDGTEAWLLVLALAVVPGVIGTVALLAGIGVIGPSLASILLTLEPPVTVLLAWIVLGERLTALQLAGGGVILVAILVAHRAAAPPPREVPLHRMRP